MAHRMPGKARRRGAPPGEVEEGKTMIFPPHSAVTTASVRLHSLPAAGHRSCLLPALSTISLMTARNQ
jgi:hypothetical protein